MERKRKTFLRERDIEGFTMFVNNQLKEMAKDKGAERFLMKVYVQAMYAYKYSRSLASVRGLFGKCKT